MDLVKPEVPNAQANKAPELLIEGFTKGMAAFAAFAKIRRDQESDLARLALQERLAQEQHQLEQSKLAQAARLIPSQIKLNLAHGEMLTEQANAYADGYGNAAQRKIVEDRQNQEYLDQFDADATKLKLKDPKFEGEDAAQYHINLNEKLMRKYGTSTLPEVQKGLAYYQSRAKAHQIPLPNIGYDKNGEPVVANGSTMVVIGDIVDALRGAETHGAMYARLKLGGYIKPGDKEKRGGWFGLGKHAATPDTPNEVAKGLIEKSQQPLGDEPTEPTAPTQQANYPVGTKAKRGGVWHTMTANGWDPPL